MPGGDTARDRCKSSPKHHQKSTRARHREHSRERSRDRSRDRNREHSRDRNGTKLRDRSPERRRPDRSPERAQLDKERNRRHTPPRPEPSNHKPSKRHKQEKHSSPAKKSEHKDSRGNNAHDNPNPQSKDTPVPRSQVSDNNMVLTVPPKKGDKGSHENGKKPKAPQQGGPQSLPAAAAPVLSNSSASRLSFGDEIQDLGGPSTAFNLAASTANRFQKEGKHRSWAARVGGTTLTGNSSFTHSATASAAAALHKSAPAALLQPALKDMDTSSSPSSGTMAFGRSLGRLYFGVAEARGARPYMEDRHVIIASFCPQSSAGQPLHDGVHRSYAAIFDGHNGERAAEVAASRLHTRLAQEPALRMYTGSSGPPAAMAAEIKALAAAVKKAFRDVDDEILNGARAIGGRDGCTALMLMRLGDMLYTGHTGDSRAVLCRGGKALRLTEDHKPQLLAERSRIEARGGRIEFQRCWRVVVEPRDGRLGSGLAVSRALGDLDFKEPLKLVEGEPDVGHWRAQADDSFIIMASDGLWDVMTDQVAVELARDALTGTSDASARVAAEALLQAALRKGSTDNITVIVAMLQWD